MKIIRKLITTVAIFILLLVALPLFIGWYLSPQDVLKKADAIVVISGGDNNERIQKGVDLYEEGWAPILVFSGAAAEGEVSNAKMMKTISISKGVPGDDILIEEKSTTTEENAEFTSDLLKREGFDSYILVTSPYHQRRAYELFKKQNEAAEITNQSAQDENWRKKGWWENNVGRFLTFGEVAKLFVNLAQNIGGKN